MILYNITVKIDDKIKDEWLEWISANYIPKVMSTELFNNYKIFRLLNEPDNDGLTFAIQFYTDTLSRFEIYLNDFANKINEEHKLKFNHQHVAFMTVLESVE